MDGSIVAIVVVPVLLFVFCATTSGLLAQRRDARLSANLPGTLSYKWGYFLGYYGIIFGIVVALALVAMTAAGAYRQWFPIVLVYLVAFGIASYGVLNRRKWGWVFQIPLSLNMGLWAFNAVYLSNRWRELT
jgi:glucan phosphoethanolaminetransferase (alkaline phosphatase superfamily)